jgi:REP element-mobilizing transposase RayT
MTAWLLTSTFYGQWLPGDPRGSVTNVRDRRPGDPAAPARLEHSRPGQDYEEAIPGLQRAAHQQLQGPPVALDLPQAEQLLAQLQETAAHRGWTLVAVSIMFNHMHVVVEAPAQVGKSELLRDFKSYAARRLNRLFGPRASGTWWTDGGSCRPIRHLPAAVFYVCHRQPKPLVVWSRDRGRIPPSESHPDRVFPGEIDDGDIDDGELDVGEPPA